MIVDEHVALQIICRLTLLSRGAASGSPKRTHANNENAHSRLADCVRLPSSSVEIDKWRTKGSGCDDENPILISLMVRARARELTITSNGEIRTSRQIEFWRNSPPKQ